MERFPMPRLPAENAGHVVIHAGSIVLAVTAQVISGFFFALTKDSYVPNVLFQISSRNVSETLPLEVSFDWWSRYYWNIVDLWSLAWLLHAVVGLFKRNTLGPESCNPEIHPPLFYLIWAIINLARICNMLLWDRLDILGSVTAMWILQGLTVCMLYMSYSNLHKHKAWLSINNPSMISWTRYLTQNGLAAFAWWSLLNAVVGLGILFKYKAGMPEPLVSTVVLIMISCCIVVWFLLQSFLLTKYLKYTFTVYPILILGLGAMFTRSYHIHNMAPNTVFCGLLMLLMTVLSCFNLFCECWDMDKSSKPVVIEPNIRFEIFKTVCRPGDVIESKI